MASAVVAAVSVVVAGCAPGGIVSVAVVAVFPQSGSQDGPPDAGAVLEATTAMSRGFGPGGGCGGT